VYTDFDWRIGVLNRNAIFATKYFMTQGHWQVAKRDANGNAEFGMAVSVPLTEVPADLLAYATEAAGLIGDSLYGVDMKMTARGAVVIEVNDNPNIDAGAEDGVLGDQLYRLVLGEMVHRIRLCVRLLPNASNVIAVHCVTLYSPPSDQVRSVWPLARSRSRPALICSRTLPPATATDIGMFSVS
jgi:hypothetical protein